MNPRSTDCEADALTTTPSRRYSATSLLLSDSCSVLSSVFSFTSNSDRSGRNCLRSPVLSGYNWSSDTRFSPGTTRLITWPDGERCLCRSLGETSDRGSLIYCIHSFLALEAYSLISFFLHTGFLDFHRGTCALRLRCNEHSLLFSFYFRIGRIENSSCSACGHPSQDTSHLILHCPATDSLRLSLFGIFVSLQPLVQALGSCPASGTPWFSAMPPSLGRGRVATTTRVM